MFVCAKDWIDRKKLPEKEKPKLKKLKPKKKSETLRLKNRKSEMIKEAGGAMQIRQSVHAAELLKSSVLKQYPHKLKLLEEEYCTDTLFSFDFTSNLRIIVGD